MDPLSTMQKTISRMTTILGGETLTPSDKKKSGKGASGKLKVCFAVVVLSLVGYAGYQTEIVQSQIAGLAAPKQDAALVDPVSETSGEMQSIGANKPLVSGAHKSMKPPKAKTTVLKHKPKMAHQKKAFHKSKKHAHKKRGKSAKVAKTRSKKNTPRT